MNEFINSHLQIQTPGQLEEKQRQKTGIRLGGGGFLEGR